MIGFRADEFARMLDYVTGRSHGSADRVNLIVDENRDGRNPVTLYGATLPAAEAALLTYLRDTIDGRGHGRESGVTVRIWRA